MSAEWSLDSAETVKVQFVTDLVLEAVHGRGAGDHFTVKDREGEAIDRFNSHACEYLLSRETRQTWNTPANLSRAGYVDVGELDEVRWRAFPSGDLILYPTDSPDSRYHLFGGQGPYIYRGWILGREGMVDELWKEAGSPLTSTFSVQRSGWFIPQSRLTALAPAKKLRKKRQRKEETEEDILNQLMWLRRTKWEQKHPWQAKQTGTSGYPMLPVLTGVSQRGSVERGEE